MIEAILIFVLSLILCIVSLKLTHEKNLRKEYQELYNRLKQLKLK